jgi:DNA-binding transcriptional LysR family regulator
MEAGSVTGAAETLHVTQPAVSRLIRDLEARFGFALFERRKGRLVATVEAHALNDVVHRSFMGLETIATAAQEVRAFRRGSLQIAAMPGVALKMLPRVITAFSAMHPGINVSLQIRSSTKVGEWIGAQQADIGFAALRSVGPGSEQRTLCTGPLVVVLPTGHRLAGREVIGPEDLEAESLVMLGTELSMSDRVSELFAARGVRYSSRLDAQLSAAVCEFVRAGAGVGLVDPVTAFQVRDEELAAVRFEPAIPFVYTLLLPANRTRPVFLPAFLSCLDTELRRNPFLEIHSTPATGSPMTGE